MKQYIFIKIKVAFLIIFITPLSGCHYFVSSITSDILMPVESKTNTSGFDSTCLGKELNDISITQNVSYLPAKNMYSYTFSGGNIINKILLKKTKGAQITIIHRGFYRNNLDGTNLKEVLKNITSLNEAINQYCHIQLPHPAKKKLGVNHYYKEN